MSRRFEQELVTACQYEPLPSLPEAELPDLVGGESYEWAAIDDLDAFFKRIYRYWHDKGLVCIVVGRLLNLMALGFTIAFSGFLLLAVNWSALHAECLLPHEPRHSCDLLAVAIHKHPWRDHSKPLVLLVGLYLMLCGLYWSWSAVQLVAELRDVLDVKHFINNKLGISDRQVRMMTWSELLHRVVLVQRTSRLCAVRDLDELDIVGRIMRKENYLIGMMNAGVLGLYVKGLGPFGGRRFMLTKTLEWNLYLCILDPMFDEHFHIKQEFVCDEGKLRQRLLRAAAINLALSPFLLLFLVIYFFMKHAERFYHSPGNLGSRRWSSLAKWRLRELNELPHYIQHRLDASYEAAVKYVGQFPSPLINQVAKFVSFVAGSFAALLLGLSLLDENLLEVPLAGRNLVWWLALTGILLTISRSFINDTPVAFDPERAMAELVLHTHYLPRHWRGRAHSAEVQQSVNSMFTFKVLLFAEELASVVLTPFILAFSLPNCVGAILQFVRDTTTRVEGVGDVCSLAVFDFGRHGNSKYGAPTHATKRMRSKQGKMEKSFLTFVATYPTWQPPPACRQMLSAIGSVSAAGAPPSAAGAPAGPGFGSPVGLGCNFAGPSTSPRFGGTATPAGGGAWGGLGPGMDHGAESVLWQQPYGSTGVVGAAASSGQQSGAGYGNSSIWVGVPEPPPGLRHPNYQQQHRHPHQSPHLMQHHHQQQQLVPPVAIAVQLQQQRQQPDSDMGAGLGGLGSSPIADAATEHCSGAAHDQAACTAVKHVSPSGDQAESTTAADAAEETGGGLHLDQLADDMFGPLSPTAVAWGQTATGFTSNQLQQQQQSHPHAGISGLQLPQGQLEPGHNLRLKQQQTAQQQHLPPFAGKSTWHSRQQQQQNQYQYQQYQQQQQQQHQMLLLQLSQCSSLLPGIPGVRGSSIHHSVLPSYPSTLYPGGPSAGAGLSRHLQQPGPGTAAAATGAGAGAHNQSMQVHTPTGPGPSGFTTAAGPWPQVSGPVGGGSAAVPAAAASFLAANVMPANSLAGSDFLPTNEREDLSSRVAASHSLLQSFYESQDLSVQHRQANRAHARSVLLGQTSSAAVVAASAAAMASAASARL